MPGPESAGRLKARRARPDTGEPGHSGLSSCVKSVNIFDPSVWFTFPSMVPFSRIFKAPLSALPGILGTSVSERVGLAHVLSSRLGASL